MSEPITLGAKTALQSGKRRPKTALEVRWEEQKHSRKFVAPLLHLECRSASGIVGYAVRMREIPETGLRLSPSLMGLFFAV